MSQKIIDLVTAVVAPAIPEPYELVDIEYEKLGGDYVLSVLIDKPGGITVEDTADLTEIISPLLDTIQPDPFPDQYMLEVSSPGLERPLKTKEALTNAVGQYINVSLYTGNYVQEQGTTTPTYNNNGSGVTTYSTVPAAQ